MLIEGLKGLIKLNGDGEIFFRKLNNNNEKLIKYKWNKKGFAGDSIFYYQQYLIDHFINGKDSVNSAEEYITNLKVEESIYKSKKQTNNRKTIIS